MKFGKIVTSAMGLAASMIVLVGSPASAASAGPSSIVKAPNSSSRAGKMLTAAASLNFALDGFQCTSSGGANGHGYIGSRGYMEELGSTNVTSMKITIVTQARFTTRPFWRNVPGSAATFTYNFSGDPNSASHSLLGPRAGLLWAYNYSAIDDANNFIYRQNVKFRWSNSSFFTTQTINTTPCFSN